MPRAREGAADGFELIRFATAGFPPGRFRRFRYAGAYASMQLRRPKSASYRCAFAEGVGHAADGASADEAFIGGFVKRDGGDDGAPISRYAGRC